MIVVVDANVICSALLAKGKTAEIIFSDKIDAIAPELLFLEVEKHKVELLNKSKLSSNEFDTLFTLLRKRIRIIPMEDFKDTIVKASELLDEHKKDIEYVALALKYNCILWSKKNRLKKIIDAKDASEIEKMIR